MFDKKTKIILGSIFFVGVGAIITKGLCDYSIYKSLKSIKNNLNHNTWKYYE